MSQPDFNEYLNSVCSQIKNKKKIAEIEEELLTHLEDNYERNIAVGMSEEQAREDAVSKMGNRETLAYRLGQLYSFSPVKAMNSALIMFTVAYWLLCFPLTGIVKEVLFVCGFPVMFSALLRMRKVNRKMKKAFWFFNSYAVAEIIKYCIGLGRIQSEKEKVILIIICTLPQILFWIFAFLGLDELNKQYIEQKRKRPKLILCAVFLSVSYVFSATMLCLNRGEPVNINAFILPIVFIVLWMVCFIQLIFLRKGLWDAEGEYGILPDDKAHLKVFLCTILSAFLVVAGANIYSAYEPIEKTKLIISDVSKAEHIKAEEIRQQMLGFDVPQKVIDDLPDSEILNYEGATYSEFCSYTQHNEMVKHFCRVDSYWFYFPIGEHKNAYDVRILMVINYDYNPRVRRTQFYRAGFYTAPFAELIQLNLQEENNGDFIQIVTDENGEKYVAEPSFTYNLEEMQKYPKGFEYREEPGQRIYFAQTYGLWEPNEDNLAATSLCAVSVRRKWLCSFQYNTTADYAKTVLGEGYYTGRSEDYLPFTTGLHRLNSDYKQ